MTKKKSRVSMLKVRNERQKRTGYIKTTPKNTHINTRMERATDQKANTETPSVEVVSGLFGHVEGY